MFMGLSLHWVETFGLPLDLRASDVGYLLTLGFGFLCDLWIGL